MRQSPCSCRDKPRYVMGVGTPEEIVEYVRLGVDMMDCVLPTRAARHGLLFTSEGKLNIKNARYARDENPLDPKCGCRVCSRYSRAYLRHLYSSQEMLAQVLNTVHNLSHYLDIMRRVRETIMSGEFASTVRRSETGFLPWLVPGCSASCARVTAQCDVLEIGIRSKSELPDTRNIRQDEWVAHWKAHGCVSAVRPPAVIR